MKQEQVQSGMCPWAVGDVLYREYHDQEWGVPQYDSRKLFELLLLEGAQAGLSWITVLRKRENYRKAFYDFDPVRMSKMTPNAIEACLKNPGIIRNRLKVNAFVTNARAYLELEATGVSFSEWIWNTVDGKPIINSFSSMEDVPVSTPASDDLSKRLKTAGFKFVGTTICYAYMQAAGLVNDHLISCYCHPKKKITL